MLNIIVGFWQDYRAEQSLQALKAMAAPTCNVLRENGAHYTVKAEELTPGDIVLLSTGDVVAADLRLVHGVNLAVDEALLTGESKSSSKQADATPDKLDCPIGDRANMMYCSTVVTRGRGVGVVVSIGMQTEIGKIALLLRDKKTIVEGPLMIRTTKRVVYGIRNALGLIGTPSQVKLSYFGLLLFALAIVLAVIVFSAAEWDLDDETLIYGICVAVAVIPESLIAVLTITMAVGSKAMARGGVIVRKMAALEAVGGVTNVCSDKTGTLTQGKMLARKAWLSDGRILTVENETSPFDPTSGEVNVQGQQILESDVTVDHALQQFFQTMALCNLASVDPGVSSGEPTEIALQVRKSMSRRVTFEAGVQDIC